MKIGGLYEIKKWFWLLFPSKDIAAAALNKPVLSEKDFEK
jgi:hypothetical protein